MFTALPMDVRVVDSKALVSAGAQDGTQWLVVAGWECQDLSPAGSCKGLDGARSSTFFDTVRIVGALQQLQADRSPRYLLENTALQHNFRSPAVRERDFARICRAVGTPLLVDTAQFGSYAHRSRNYWTNLADTEQVSLVVRTRVKRAPGRSVDQVLDPGHTVQVVTRPDPRTHYPCNEVGKPRRVLPTLVAYPNSRAFMVDGDGRPQGRRARHRPRGWPTPGAASQATPAGMAGPRGN